MKISSLLTSEKTKRIVPGIIFYFSLALSLFLFFFLVHEYMINLGRDMRVFCSAGAVIRRSGNPYIVAELNNELSWNYLPVYAYPFRVLCSRFDFMEYYPIWYSILFLLSIEIWLNHKTWLYGMTIVATGLFALGWVLISGNLGVVELALISLSTFWLLKGRIPAAFFSLGIIASVKLFPLLYLPIYLLVLDDWKRRRSALVWAAAGFLLPSLISAVLRPDLMPWYFSQLLGLIPNQHSAINEVGGINTPSLFYLLTDLLSAKISSVTNMALATLFLLLMSVGAYFLWRKVLPSIPNEFREEFTLGMGIVVMTLLMPRNKPYSFLPALLFVYILTRHTSLWKRALVLLLTSILPLAAYYSYMTSWVKTVIQTWPAFVRKEVLLLQSYHQVLFLLLVLILLMVWAHSQSLYPKPSTVEQAV